MDIVLSFRRDLLIVDRIRHVKCDESKPACSKCTITGRRCDYLDFPLSHSNKHSSPGQTASIRSARSPNPTSLSDDVLAWPSNDDYVSLCLDYFRVVCCKEFQGYYTTRLWDSFFLQVSHVEASIRHAVLALSALHYSIYACDLSSKRSSFKQYAASNFTTAVRELNGRLDQSLYSHKLALYASLIFTLYELLTGDEVVSLFHLRHGVNIIASLWSGQFTESDPPDSGLSRPRYDTDTDLREIASAFARAATQVTVYGVRYMFTPLVVPELPAQFTSLSGLQGARYHLELIIFYMYTTIEFRYETLCTLPLEPLEQSLQAQILVVTEMLSRWSSALKNLEASSPPTTVEDQTVSHILHVRSRLASLKLATHFYKGESIYDEYLTDFEDIISRCEKVVSANSNKRNFSIDTAIVQPLYFVSLKCRRGVLRRRALTLLGRAGREGAHDGRTLAAIARWIIEREEADSKEMSEDEQVGSAARMRTVTHHLDRGGDYVRILCARRDEEGQWTCFAGVSWYDGVSRDLGPEDAEELDRHLKRYREWTASIT